MSDEWGKGEERVGPSPNKRMEKTMDMGVMT